MACYTDNITELTPLTIPGTRSGMIFRWTDTYTGKLYQIYVNGKLAGETKSIHTPKQLSAPVSGSFVWQIIAIDPADKGTDYSSFLDYSDTHGNKVELRWPRRSTELEVGSYVNIYWDAGTGTIIDTTAINSSPIYNFPPNTPAWGFGLGGFGDLFGYDGEGIGFGMGNFGVGEFGFDCDYVTWKSAAMPPDVYKFTTMQYDSVGNIDNGGATEFTVVVDCPPSAPQSIVIKSFVPATNILTLTVTEGVMPLPY